MNIQGLSPVARIAGKSIRFILRPRDALAWISAESLDESQETQLLAICPEALVFSLSFYAGGGRFCIQDLIRSLKLTDSDDDRVMNHSLDADLKKRFLKTLGNKSSGDESKKAILSTLIQLIAGSCSLSEAAVAGWIDGIQFPKGFWDAISRSTSTEVLVKVTGNIGGNHGEAVSDFERRLNLEKMASMKQLAYGASHEINNPLANIASRAQTLLMDETDPDRRLRLAKINQQAFRAHEMIADMMLFAHPPEPEFTLSNPAEIVSEVAAEMESLAEQQQTRLNLDLKTNANFTLDKTQLAVAVKAMITNSLESLQDSGTVDVRLAIVENSDPFVLLITVTDDGPGIAPETMKHLFDPFYSGREAGRGLGFGLSKVWRIAELHGGKISAESPPGGGARFCLRIPYRDAG